MELHWTDHLLFLIVGILIPLKAVFGTQPQLAGLKFSTRMKIQLYWGNNAYLWVLTGVVAAVWWGNGRAWYLIGIDWPFSWPTGWPLVAMLVFVLLYLGDTLSEVRTLMNKDQAVDEMSSSLGFLPQTSYEYFHYIFLALTAGICEEFIFRGYFIRYFQTVFSSEYSYTLAIFIPAAIFGFVHFYQGWRSVVKITAMAIMFGFVFVHTESLWMLFVIHASVDLLGGAIAWRLLGDKGKPINK